MQGFLAPERIVEPFSSPEDHLVSRTLAGKYRLVEVLGSGAFGTLFKAHQFFCRQFVRPVAVKVSRQTGLTEDSAPEVFRDALLLAQLVAGGPREGKQQLVPIYDLGILADCEGRGFLVMELVEGVPLLSPSAPAGHSGVAAGLRYLKEICRGLALLHAQGAVHRDLKPDNVLLDRAGVVRLVDVGLAAFTTPVSAFTVSPGGAFIYTAPETLQGSSTPAADVYGLGLLMYELFTGGGPHRTAPWPSSGFASCSEEYLRIKETVVFPPPSEGQKEIRGEFSWLDDLILRCLDVDPARRFRDAGQLLAAIEACEAGGSLPPLEGDKETRRQPDKETRATPLPTPGPLSASSSATVEDLFREVRRLLANRAFDQVIDRLDVHRPAEWAVVDVRGARVLRILGQAYLGRGEVQAARECLEQFRAVQKEQALLSRQDHAAALSDLVKCYRALGHPDLADACQQEAQNLLRESN
jgi:serine/threonine-protein kinase